jgi:hypothetical protein
MGLLLRISWGLRAVMFSGSLAVSVALGQDLPSASSTTPQTVVDVLHQLSDKADVIFAGQVMAIRHPKDGVVEIEFRVDQAIRGCSAGTPYLLHEWAGLWAGDTQRYRIGQRLLMLLHAPSAAGMSSPVGGLDGAIPIRQSGAAPSHGVTPRQPPFVDLRWLGTRLPRTVSYRNEPAEVESGQTPRGLTARVTPLTIAGGNASSGEASVPAQQASVDAVIGMLTSWQKAQHVAP